MATFAGRCPCPAQSARRSSFSRGTRCAAPRSLARTRAPNAIADARSRAVGLPLRSAGTRRAPAPRPPTVAGAGAGASGAPVASAAAGGAGAGPLEALLFDCDGVLVDTERDGHRVSFNQAFAQKGLAGVEWSVEEYGELLAIGGGKERMSHYFNQVGWPSSAPLHEGGRKALVADLHQLKTRLFMDLVDTGALPLRPGVARLVDEALRAGVNVAVCSTSNEKAVSAIVRVMLGPERAQAMRIFAGDIVPRKKPDPAIYTLAASSLGVDPAKCAVVEDSHIGLTAAKAAGMTCVVTTSGYTEGEDFAAADVVFPCIGDTPHENFDLGFLQQLLIEKAQRGVMSSS